MQITIARPGQQLGPFSLDEVNAHLASGFLLPQDLAWWPGQTDWVPLSTVSGIQGQARSGVQGSSPGASDVQAASDVAAPAVSQPISSGNAVGPGIAQAPEKASNGKFVWLAVLGVLALVFFVQSPSGFVTLVGLLSLVALGIGWKRPQALRFLLGEKATRGRITAAAGGLFLVSVLLLPAFSDKAPSGSPQRASMPETVGAGTEASKNAQAEKPQAEKPQAEKLQSENTTAENAPAQSAVAQSDKAAGTTASPNRVAETKVNQAEQAAREREAEAASRNVRIIKVDGVGQREMGVVDDVQYVIYETEKAGSLGNEFTATQADGVFLVLHMGAHNSDKETHDINTSIMKLLDSQGREFDPSHKGRTALALSGVEGADIGLTQVQPGINKKLTLVYDIPENATGLRLKIPGGFLSTSGDAVINLP